jgi:hypothetical protein
VKKGRHRRFEEARALKRITEPTATEPCVECGARADEPCAPWCLARVPEDDDRRGDGVDSDEFDDDEFDDDDEFESEFDGPDDVAEDDEALDRRGARQ